MKLIKIFGLALVAALVTMAFAGAGTASAKTSLCKEKVELCPEGQRYANGQQIKAESQEQGKLKDVGIFGETIVSCQKSTITGEITETQGEKQQVIGKIKTATWEECKRVNVAQETLGNCTVTAVQLPWTVHIEQKEVQDGNGTMWIGPQPGGLQAGARVECEGKPTVTYKGKEKQPNDGVQEYGQEWIQMQITGGNPAKATANQQELKSDLGTQGLWDAQYKMVEPAEPLFVTQQ